jgi:alkanesulfonate monooxygenase SsuD/methylene tetrahydromethanopterin reductase-like flavin-dependent oxidoreductase (luciferase family)
VHDIADLEGRGLIGVFLASSEFRDAADAQAAALGLAVPYVLVPHPIQDRTDEELVALADAAYDEVLASITSRTGTTNTSPGCH